MKNNLKKILVLGIVTVLIIPQITFASWWNPFSWAIFNKPQTVKVETKQSSGTEGAQSKTTTSTSVQSATKTPIVSNPKAKTTVSTSLTKLSNAQIIAKVKPATVYIETEDGSGSGMIISSDGYVLTNAHVVSGVSTATVTLSTNKQLTASVVGRDENLDIAVLKINTAGLPIVTLGNSDTVNQGDNVFALGFPFGIKGDVSFTSGVISRLIEQNGDSWFQTTAEIHPGNSGGPLVNQYGEVVGINNASYTDMTIKGIQLGETIKFAITINIAKNNITALKNGRNIVTDTSIKTSVANQSCEVIGNESLIFNVKYDVISQSYLDIVSTLNNAWDSTSLTGADAFKHWYQNWVAIHDQTKTKVSNLQAKIKQNSYSFSSINQDDFVKMHTAFLQATLNIDSYYNFHLDSLNMMQGVTYLDDYLAIKMKDLFSADISQKQKANEYYNTAMSLYKSIQNNYNQLKTSNGCPLKIVKTIKRSVLDALQINSALQCSQLSLSSSDVDSCNSYRNYKSYYDWNIIEDNR